MTPSIGNGVSLSTTLREIAPVGEVRDREERENRRAEQFETEAPPPRDDPPRQPPEPRIDDRRSAEPEPRERIAPRDIVEVDTTARRADTRPAESERAESRPIERPEPEADPAREVSQAPVVRPVETGPAPEVTLTEEFPPPRTTPGNGDLRDINSRPQLSGDTLLYLTTARFPVPNLVVDQQRANAAYQQAQAASAQASIARVAFADTADQQVSA